MAQRPEKKDESQVSNPPESYLEVISPLIDTARRVLESGESLVPMAFVGNFRSGQTIPIALQTGSDQSKDSSALAIRMAAEALEAEFVFVIMDAWALRNDKLHQMQAILDMYGSIGASPYAIDVVSFGLETRYGVWMAQCEIKPKGISKKKKTIGQPQFQFYTEVTGRFSHLLPIAQGDAFDFATLH